MKQILLLVILSSVISFWGCEDNDETSSFIAGVVVDSISQLPIDSVSGTLFDTIRNPSFSTDSLGAFRRVIFGEGIKRVFFQKEGYNTKFQDFNFSDNPTDLKVELVKQ